jgi:radical SAM superfamily enzyme YgiQ (UPF0313 family)
MVEGAPPTSYFSVAIEHLGLMSIKAFARLRDITVDVVDGIVYEHLDTSETLRSIVEIGRRRAPALIGFSVILGFTQSVELARACKQLWPDVFIVFGHDIPALNWHKLLSDYSVIDGVVTGDGEVVLFELAYRLLNEKSIEDTPGLAYRDARDIPTSNRGGIVDLNALPWVCRDELPKVRALGFSAGVFASRGCPYRCQFCTTGHLSSKTERPAYRTRAVDDIVAECLYLWQGQGCDFITICDDLFVLPSVSSRNRAHAFADALEKSGFRGKFMLDARIDSIDKDLFLHLKSAGLARVFVGVESADESTLNRLNKRYALKGRKLFDALNVLVDMELDVIPGIIAFDPFVTPDHLSSVLAVMEHLKFYSPSMLTSPLRAFPGTRIHQVLEEQGLLRKKWPVGEWLFKSAAAEKAYQRIVSLVEAYPKTEHWSALAAEVRDVIDDWGASYAG